MYASEYLYPSSLNANDKEILKTQIIDKLTELLSVETDDVVAVRPSSCLVF